MHRRFYVVFAIALSLGIGTIVTSRRAESQKTTQSGDEAMARVAGELDALCEKAWAAAEVKPRVRTSSLAIARRLSLALTGTVPSLEEIRTIEGLPEGKRIDRYLDHLLSTRRFADYFAERLSRAFVGDKEGPFLIFRRRRFVYWLSDAIYEQNRYDAIVREMVAGTGLWTDKPGTNFITAHERDPVQLTARTTRAFLGMRLDCAQCHDHPFAHWKQADFEGLAAFYAGIEQNITGIVDSDKPFKPTGRMMMMDADPPKSSPGVPFAKGALPADSGMPLRKKLAAWLTSPSNPAFGKAIANRVWTMMIGRSLTRTGVDDIEGGARIEGALDLLGKDFVEGGYDLRRLIRTIAKTRAFAMQSGGTYKQEDRFASFPAVKLRAEQIAGSLVQMSQLHTIASDSHILWQLVRAGNVADFVRRYGDAGQDEMREQAGTISQRLVMMNGRIVRERIEANLFSAAGRIAGLSPNDSTRVKVAFLVALTRYPTAEELAKFKPWFKGLKGDERNSTMEDLLWALANSTEFSWNH